MSAQTRFVITCDKVTVMIGTQSLTLRRRGCPKEEHFAGLASVTQARKLLAQKGWAYFPVPGDLCPEHAQEMRNADA